MSNEIDNNSDRVSPPKEDAAEIETSALQQENYLLGNTLPETSGNPAEKNDLPQVEFVSDQVGEQSPNNQGQNDAAVLAEKANQAMQDSFLGTLDGKDAYFKDLISKERASSWDLGQVLEADIETGSTANFDRDKELLEKYWDTKSNPPGYTALHGPSGDKYYDDNAWIGIAMMDAYKENQDPEYLKRAEEVFKFVEHGSEGTDQFANPGGVLWSQEKDNQYRATVSTAGAAQLALQLYEQTHDQKYLDFAKEQHDWINANLKAPDGLYYDGMEANGSIEGHEAKYSYNQGLMLGNATMLYEATGDPKYLQEAQDIAKVSVDNFKQWQNGKQPGQPEPFHEQTPFFNAVFFKNLMHLDSIAPDPSYRQALADNASYLAQKFGAKDNVIRNQGESTLRDQSSAVQILALAGKYPPA